MRPPEPFPFNRVGSASTHKVERHSSDQRSLVSGFSKDATQEAWAADACSSPPRGALNKIHLPTATQQDPAAKAGTIIDQALTVVMNIVADSSAAAEVPSRKIAKKRRKENDEDGLSSSIHHTTSCKEYLRKVQETLRRSSPEPASSDTESSNEERQVPAGGRANSRLQPARPQPASPKKEADCQPSRGEGASDPYGYEDPDAVMPSRPASDPYGYEDPDAVMPSRGPTGRRGTYRRRGSVTKFSIQASAAAAAATERIMRLGLKQLESPRSLRRQNSIDRRLLPTSLPLTDDPVQSSVPTQPLHQRVRRSAIGTRGARSELPRSVAYPRSNSASHGICSNGQVGAYVPAWRKGGPRRHSWKGNVQQASENVHSSNPYGYEDPDANQNGSNPYGYEDPDSRPAGNPYGYGDAIDPPKCEPSRRRATRRGSVTKFSLEATKVVAGEERSSEAVYKQPLTANHAEQPPYQRSPNLRTPAGIPSSILRTPEFTMRQSLLVNNPMSPYADTASSYRQNGSAAPKDSECLSDTEGSSDIDSVASFGEISVDIKDAADAPARPPNRIDSIESDASSLAPDLRSFCSISRHDRSDESFSPQATTRKFSREDLSSSMGLCGEVPGFRDALKHARSSSFNGRESVPLVTFPEPDAERYPLIASPYFAGTGTSAVRKRSDEGQRIDFTQ